MQVQTRWQSCALQAVCNQKLNQSSKGAQDESATRRKHAATHVADRCPTTRLHLEPELHIVLLCAAAGTAGEEEHGQHLETQATPWRKAGLATKSTTLLNKRSKIDIVRASARPIRANLAASGPTLNFGPDSSDVAADLVWSNLIDSGPSQVEIARLRAKFCRNRAESGRCCAPSVTSLDLGRSRSLIGQVWPEFWAKLGRRCRKFRHIWPEVRRKRQSAQVRPTSAQNWARSMGFG